jgi:hypothetical protein
MAQSQELYARRLVASLARHQDRALRLRCETQELLAATRETLAQSPTLVAKADAVPARDTTRTNCP